MKTVWNGLCTALGKYSVIPMPRVVQDDKTMKYAVCFWPVIGLPLGLLIWIWGEICIQYGFGQVCFALVSTVFTMVITGGVHMEEFMQVITMESSRDKNRAVVATACYFLLFTAGMTQIWKAEQFLLLVLSFLLSRALAGLSLVWFSGVKNHVTPGGSLSATSIRTIRIVLVSVSAISIYYSVLSSPILGSINALGALWVWTFCYYKAKRKKDENTTNIAGYLLSLCEVTSVLIIGLLGRSL